jgi:aldose sugar dehydrogenase
MKSFNRSNIILLVVAIISLLLGNFLYLGQYFNLRRIEANKIYQNPNIGNTITNNTMPVDYEVKTISSGFTVPWSISFTSESRMIVTERTGRVRVIVDGVLDPKPLHVFDDVISNQEEGLMGMAVDPDYIKNKYLYFMYAYKINSELKIKVVRLADAGNILEAQVILLDGLKATENHAGGRIAFGPDKKLYITTGDAIDLDLPMDLNSLNGKLLRMNNDGTVPADNPFPNSLVWSYGHRNSQGIAWDSRNGNLLSTEHGPSIFDGPTGGDELNQIIKGGNYGWPKVSHGRKLEGSKQELIQFTPAIAPSGIVFYTGNQFPQFQNTFLFTALAGKGLFQVVTNNSNPTTYINYQKLAKVDIGRIRDIAQSPEGKLYFVSSNTDNWGKAKEGEDKIYQLIPKK